MSDEQIKNMAVQAYNLGIQMAETFARDKTDRDYMILAIMACIHGLNNSTYSLMPMAPSTGNYFKELRKEKGYTLRQTEDATGISNAYLSQLENGKIKKPSQYVVNLLINWYQHGVTVNKSESEFSSLNNLTQPITL